MKCNLVQHNPCVRKKVHHSFVAQSKTEKNLNEEELREDYVNEYICLFYIFFFKYSNYYYDYFTF